SRRGSFFGTRPGRLPYPVTVAFGDPMPSSVTANDVRFAIMELGAEAMRERRAPSDQLHVAFARVARRHFLRFAMADSTGQRLRYGQTLLASVVLGRAIRP